MKKIIYLLLTLSLTLSCTIKKKVISLIQVEDAFCKKPANPFDTYFNTYEEYNDKYKNYEYFDIYAQMDKLITPYDDDLYFYDDYETYNNEDDKGYGYSYDYKAYTNTIYKEFYDTFSKCTNGKYHIKNGYPEWLFNPDMENQTGIVGVAKNNIKGGYGIRKALAFSIAKGKLIKYINKFVKQTCYADSKTESDNKVPEYYQSLINCNLRHPAYDLIKSIAVKDDWTDTRSGILYVWLILDNVNVLEKK